MDDAMDSPRCASHGKTGFKKTKERRLPELVSRILDLEKEIQKHLHLFLCPAGTLPISVVQYQDFLSALIAKRQRKSQQCAQNLYYRVLHNHL